MTLKDPFDATICLWKKNAKAALTISFDGAYKMTYDLVVKHLFKYNIPATWFVVTGCVGRTLEGRRTLSWSDLRTASLEGMEIGSHSVSHPLLKSSLAKSLFKVARLTFESFHKKKLKILALNRLGQANRTLSGVLRESQCGMSYSQVREEVFRSKQEIEGRIPFQKVLSFAYPGGRYNSALKEDVKKAGYLSARSTDEGYNFIDSSDFYALKSKVWNKDVRVEEANQWVNFALERNAWLIETYHTISPRKNDYYFNVLLSDFESHIAYISPKNIWIDTQQNIIKYIREKVATKIDLEVLPAGAVMISAKNTLEPNIYDQALTLETRVPSTWSKVRIMQDQKVYEVRPLKKGGRFVVYYDLVPNRGKTILEQSA